MCLRKLKLLKNKASLGAYIWHEEKSLLGAHACFVVVNLEDSKYDKRFGKSQSTVVEFDGICLTFQGFSACLRVTSNGEMET